MRLITCLILIIGLCTISIQPALGQDSNNEENEGKSTVTDASIDLAVPDSPAFAVLGLTPNDVVRPSSPREFGTALLNGIDTNGNFQTGIAIDASPYMLLRGDSTTLDQYQNKWAIRFLSRSQLSFATAKGASNDDKSVKLALGLRFTLWDEGDPRMDDALVECLKKAVSDVEISIDMELEKLQDERNQYEKKLNEVGNDEKKKKKFKRILKDLKERIEELESKGTAELNEVSAKKIEECRNTKSFQSNLWNRSGWALGIAPTMTSTTGKSSDLEYSGVALWTSLALRLGNPGQAILHVRYRTDEEVPDMNNPGSHFKQDSTLIGGRIRYGKPDIHVNLESSYIYNDRKNGQEDDDLIRYSLGAEYRINKDLWITASIGSGSDNENGDNISILTNLKWAFSPSPTLKFD